MDKRHIDIIHYMLIVIVIHIVQTRETSRNILDDSCDWFTMAMMIYNTYHEQFKALQYDWTI